MAKPESPMKDLNPQPRKLTRLKILAFFLTLAGLALFVYFITEVGLAEIWEGIGRVGFGGFLIVFLLYAVRLCIRSFTWSYSVEKPYRLRFRDAFPAVVMGEAMSSIIPLGIIVSGTTKGLAVRKKLPLVAGLSALAVENLFYSFVTGLYITFGALALIWNFNVPEVFYYISGGLVAVVTILIIAGIVMIVQQWHFASATAEWVYQKGFLRTWLETARTDVRNFENRIYGFYRRQPGRFLPLVALQVLFHLLGILEVWLILSFISEVAPALFSAFLLESVSRVIVVTFKLVPFVLGVDEAAAQFITDTLKLGAGLGVTLAIVRKGARVIWALLGVLLLVNRGFSIRELFHHHHAASLHTSKHDEDEKLFHQTN
jgi:hypothetical protein